MRRPGVRTEVERIEREEAVLLDALLKARQEAGLTQAQVAERMGEREFFISFSLPADEFLSLSAGLRAVFGGFDTLIEFPT